jgi:hypothetical protein
MEEDTTRKSQNYRTCTPEKTVLGLAGEGG